MRITVDLDDDLLASAQKSTAIRDTTALIHAGLRALIAHESAKRLARLGGSDPSARAPRRRRSL